MGYKDNNEQPAPGIHAHANLKKNLEHLLGLCRGLVADNKLNSDEVLFLDTWLKDHADLRQTWAGDILGQRLDAVLDDGMVTAEEADDLKATIEQIIGGGLEDGVTGGNATTLPVDADAQIEIDGATFCLTGAFVYGPRKRCEQALANRGGRAASNVSRKVTYLVIGALASRDWVHTSHGTKIEKAIQLQRQGAPIIIVDETMLTPHL